LGKLQKICGSSICLEKGASYGMKAKKLSSLFLAAVGFFVFASRAAALDFFLRPQGSFLIAMDPGNTGEMGGKRYAYGYGGGLGAEIDFASVWSNPLGLSYSAGLEAGILSTQTLIDSASSPLFYGGGLTLALGWFPFSRLFTRLEGGIGIYESYFFVPKAQTNNGDSSNNPSVPWTNRNYLLHAGGELGFRINPMFTVAANLGWRQFQWAPEKGGALEASSNSGLYAGLTLHMVLETGVKTDSGGAAASLVQDEAVYSVFAALYQNNPVGMLTIRNHENAEIRDVRVSFRAGKYTTSEFDCGAVSLIAKGRSAVVPLYADFSPEILRFSDKGRVLGEVVIRYRFLGQERQALQPLSVAIHNQNAVPSGDSQAFAAFISPTSPEVLEYTKYVTGLARAKRKLGLNQKMEFGVWLFEALRESVLVNEEEKPADTAAELQESALQEAALQKSAQFPAQTLSFGSGSSQDAALLYAALLEAAGIRAALVTLQNGDMLAAYDLGLDKNSPSAAALFNGTDRLLLLEDGIWMPVAMCKLNEGFSAARDEAANRLARLAANGESAEVVIVEDAWANYPPAFFPALGITVAQPEQAALQAAADSSLRDYLRTDLAPKLPVLQNQLRANASAAQYNQLGILQMRSGNIQAAKTAFEQAAGMGHTGAMTNRGNLALSENDNAVAERWFKQALAKEPQNRVALRGLEIVDSRR
jgi:hypothetical protein